MRVPRSIYVLTLILTACLSLAAAPLRADSSLVQILKANPDWAGTADGTYSLAITFRISGDPGELEGVSYRWQQGIKRNGVDFKLDDKNVEFMILPAWRKRWYRLKHTSDGFLEGSLTGLSKNGNPFELFVLLQPVSAEEARAAPMDRPQEGETKLSPDEVRATFIGTPWHGPSGAFIFREDGTYTFKNFDKSEPLGPWSYTITADGTLEGDTTSYTFYKSADGYRYYHSRSERFYPAKPNMPPFL